MTLTKIDYLHTIVPIVSLALDVIKDDRALVVYLEATIEHLKSTNFRFDEYAFVEALRQFREDKNNAR